MTIFDVEILILAIIANLGLMGFVYYRNPKSATHRLFTLLTVIMMAWSLANFFSYVATDPQVVTWLVRAVMMFAVPMSVVFFLLMYTFPRATMPMSRRTLFIWIFVTFITMGVAISPLLFPEVIVKPGEPPHPIAGIGMILFLPVAVGTIPLGMYYLIAKTIKATGVQKVQLRFLSAGVFIMYSLIFGLIIIAVNVYGVTLFIPYAPLFTLPFVGLTAYTIIRHRLMDIRAALFRTLSLTFLIGAVLLIYGLAVVFTVPLLADITGLRGDIIAGALALLSLPVARFIQSFFNKITDKFFFKNRIDYQKALVEESEKLSGTIKIDQVTAIVLDATNKILRSGKTVILLRKEEGGAFVTRAFAGVPDFNHVIQPDNVILEHLHHTNATIVQDELALQKEKEKSTDHIEEIEVIEDVLDWLDVAVIIPLFVNKSLTGIILLGDKLSGEPYLQDDLEFLAAFAPQAAVALENARLYGESLEFGKKLKIEVERATSELATANDQLKDLDKAKSEFLSIASHQLRTPLTALRGYVSMMIEGDFGEVPEKQQPILDILNKSATRLIDLINSLLDISRIESGRLELNLQETDVGVMVSELVSDLLPNAIKKGLILEYHKPAGDEDTKVVADAQRLRQVMLNFIDNSIKYTDKGRVDVYATREGDKVVFSVKDTGKGISREDLVRLFNKFTRVGGASRYNTEGTGLGLYVAKQIVKEHHGEVIADSEGEGKGSMFGVELPAMNTPNSLKVGEKVTVTIKASEAGQGSDKQLDEKTEGE